MLVRRHAELLALRFYDDYAAIRARAMRHAAIMARRERADVVKMPSVDEQRAMAR